MGQGRAHDGTIRTERVDEMWGTDLTSTMTGEGQASIFVTVDHCSTEFAVSASTPRAGRPASRRSSRCAKVCAPAFGTSPRGSRAA